MLITGNQQLIRNVNRQAILREIRKRPGISRSDLAELTGLTRAAIGRLVEGLTADGWLVEEVRTVSSSLGRRPTPLVFDPFRLVLLGAHINAERSRVVACTLSGEVFEQNVLSTEGLSATDVLNTLAQQIGSMQRRFMTAGRRVCGIGVAVPGPVDPISGALRFSESTGWAMLPVRAGLQTRLNEMDLPQVPLMVERALNCIALQHAENNRLELNEALLYVHAGQSVAVSTMLHGHLVRGHNGMAGYVAHQTLRTDGPLCSCGRAGCVQAMLTLGALSRRIGLPYSLGMSAPMESVMKALAAKESETVVALDEYCDLFSAFVYNLSQIYDPARIFVGGLVFQAIPGLMAQLQLKLEAMCAEAALDAPQIQLMQSDGQSAAQGAAAGVLRALLSLETALPQHT